jgi:ATP-dependent Clp protease ATP-binding subunit ClpA
MTYERFTDRARQVVLLAHEEARGLRHGYVGTEHLLLGLAREEHGIAARALSSYGLTAEVIRTEIVQIVGRGGGPEAEAEERTTALPEAPQVKLVLEFTLREALALGNNYVGTEHILLGLEREGRGVASRILAAHVGDLARIRALVMRLLVPRLVAATQQAPDPHECYVALARATAALLAELRDERLSARTWAAARRAEDLTTEALTEQPTEEREDA